MGYVQYVHTCYIPYQLLGRVLSTGSINRPNITVWPMKEDKCPPQKVFNKHVKCKYFMQAWNPQDENAPSPFLAPTGGTTLIEEAVKKFILFHSIWANYELIPKPECFGHFEGDSPDPLHHHLGWLNFWLLNLPVFLWNRALGAALNAPQNFASPAAAQQGPLRLV